MKKEQEYMNKIKEKEVQYEKLSWEAKGNYVK